MTARTLFTIGYERALLRDVVATLTAAGVVTLLDVRDRPISRRPGFSKRQLTAAIEDAGMHTFICRGSGHRRRAALPTGAVNGIGFGASSRRSSPAPRPSSTFIGLQR